MNHLLDKGSIETKKKSTAAALNISPSHSKQRRQDNDFYATQPLAIELLLKIHPSINNRVWECAVGQGHISNILEKNGFTVRKSDLIDRGVLGAEIVDFLDCKEIWDGDIITNPPFSMALEFVQHSLDLVKYGNQVIMFLKIQFLESAKRASFFNQNPPKIIYIPSSRLNCARDGDFDKYHSSSAMFCWYVWEKGFKGDPIIKWFN